MFSVPSPGPLRPLVALAVALILLVAEHPVGVVRSWLPAAFGLAPPPGGTPTTPAARQRAIPTPHAGTRVAGAPAVGPPRAVSTRVAGVRVTGAMRARPSPRGTRSGAAARPGAPVPGWQQPVDGPPRVGRPFEAPATPYGPGHRGVDLVAAVGTPVRAAADGVVSFTGLVAGRGVVTLRHGRLRTTYEPVGPTVRLGQRVRAGQVIGLLVGGHPGCPAAACLHWGLLTDHGYLDPLMLLARPVPRLLPLAAG